MKTHPDILLVERQTISSVTFEIIPDLLDWIEFWCITRKPFNMQTRIVHSKFPHHWPFVNVTIVPDDDDLAS